MKMVIARDGSSAVVRLAGRLDGEWAQHLSGTLFDFLRDGVRSVILDMAEVTYISSAGTQALATRYQDFSALRGDLRVMHPSPVVLGALRVVGMEDRLLYEEPVEVPISARTRSSALMHRMSDFTRDDWRVPDAPHPRGRYETSTRESGVSLTCHLHGDPGILVRRSYGESDLHAAIFPDSVFGLGLGAIGTAPSDCLPRLGEFLAVGGVAAYLPTDGALIADYQIGSRSDPARAMLAYGMTCEGRFSHLVRFGAQPNSDTVPLAELAEVCLEVSGGRIAGLVVVAETAGLVGAGLRRPPVRAHALPFTFDPPDISDWLSFTPEQAHRGTTAVVAGIVARDPGAPLASYLRPLGGPGALQGHCHAVVFPYSPVPQRTVAMQALVLRLFGNLKVRSLLHLISDDRGPVGSGDNAFLRGLCWVSQITNVVKETP